MSGVPSLNQPLVLEAPVPQPDGSGGEICSWVPVATLWGSLRPVSARERIVATGFESAVSHRITLRALPRGCALWPSAAHRFRLDERIFAIHAAAEDGDLLMTVWASDTGAS